MTALAPAGIWAQTPAVPVAASRRDPVRNETSGGIENYERQLDSAYTLYRSLGLDAVKSGYVTDLTSEGHSHYSRYMVNHYRKMIETAAKYGIMLNVHEPMHDAGERRTWPNMMSREGSRDQEYNAWSGDGGNPPEHETILFFTACSRARWALLPASSTSSSGAVDSPGGPTSRECGPRWPSSSHSKSCSIRRSRWRPWSLDQSGQADPLPVTITRRPVTSATRRRLVLAPGGGQAIRIGAAN